MSKNASFNQAFEIAEHIEGWSKRIELLWLFHAAQNVPVGGLWIEIGSWKGRSMLTTVAGLPRNATFLAIDPHLDSLSLKQHSFQLFPHRRLKQPVSRESPYKERFLTGELDLFLLLPF